MRDINLNYTIATLNISKIRTSYRFGNINAQADVADAAFNSMTYNEFPEAVRMRTEISVIPIELSAYREFKARFPWREQNRRFAMDLNCSPGKTQLKTG